MNINIKVIGAKEGETTPLGSVTVKYVACWFLLANNTVQPNNKAV
jgi:hypothetical protein